MDRSKKYKHTSGKGLYIITEDGRKEKRVDTHAAWSDKLGRWSTYLDTGEEGYATTSSWDDETVREFIAGGNWIEYNPTNEEDTMNPIFGYKASDELHTDSWAQLCVATSTIETEALADTFKAWEKEYKETTSMPLPGAWRSAKSVIKNARANGVAVMSGSEVVGKTAVERMVKAAKHDSVPVAYGDKTDKVVVAFKKAAELAISAGLAYSYSIGNHPDDIIVTSSNY